MKRTNLELIVGGIIFLSLFVLITGILWLKQVSITSKLVKYTVVFPNVGTLQKGDPVTVNGVRGGSVSSISLKGSGVAVELNLNEDIVFTDSSHVSVQNIGLMGERMVHIKLSDKGTPYVPDTKDKKTYIIGTFDSGIAEAMGMLGNVLENVSMLVDSVGEVVYSTIGNQEFVDFFDNFINRVDTVVFLVDELVQKNKTNVDVTVRNLRKATDGLKGLVEENRGNINKITDNGAKLTDDALLIAEKIDSISTAVDRIVTDIEAGKGSVGLLLEDDEVVRTMENTLKSLDTLVNDVDDNGLKLRLKVFGNKKYFKSTKEVED